MNTEQCSYCGKPQQVAKGLCRACYYRQRRNGTLERKKVRKRCKFERCDEFRVSHGYCEKHWYHVQRYGDPVSPFGYGERREHPLYDVWRSQKRCAQGRELVWDDFWQFVGDIDKKPKDCIARRADNSRPWGPENFYWHPKVGSSRKAKEYAREWRKQNPLASKSHSLKKHYGITLETYLAMYEAQDGRCAICDVKKGYFNAENGRSDTLVVDHDHETGKIRKLLCPDCNKGLGSFRDSTMLLYVALQYLEEHN